MLIKGKGGGGGGGGGRQGVFLVKLDFETNKLGSVTELLRGSQTAPIFGPNLVKSPEHAQNLGFRCST